MKQYHSNNHRFQSGVTLLEVLVAILIISFGLLGVAALQVTGLKNNNSALHRTNATVLASDMLDRMRANRSALKKGDYDTGGSFKKEANKYPSPTTMQQRDMNDWLTALGRRLPSGEGQIEAAAGAGTVRVTIRWNDERGAGGQSAQTLSVESQGCLTGDGCYF